MKKFISMLLLVATIAASGVTTFAQEATTPTMAQQQESYVLGSIHPEYGELIDYQEIREADGTITRECLYKLPRTYAGTYGTDTFTKTKSPSSSLGATITMKVTATFKWNSNDRTVYVSNEKGEVTKIYAGAVSNEKTTTSGNGSSKASATFSCTWKPKYGNSVTQSVKISCNYKGTDS